jgi:uncharacterized protein involved in exopolysaccharide biosynthesis
VEEQNRLTRLLGLVGHLWDRKIIVALCTLAGALAGLAYALLAPEIFVSSAIVYPKEISATTTRSLLGSGFGAALDPLTGVGHLSRIEIVLKSPELAATVIEEEKLLPELLPARWDAAAKRWKGAAPSASDGVRRLQNRLSTRVSAYKMTLEVKVRAGDPGTAHRILCAYLEALNERIKENVIHDAAANRTFLESQLVKTYDPWIRDKIQQLILNQIETGMLLNANGFEVLEGPIYPRMRESPLRRQIVLLSAAVAFALACAGVLLAAAIRNGRPAARRD